MAPDENELHGIAAAKLAEVEELLQGYLEQDFGKELSRKRATILVLHLFGMRVYGYRTGSVDRMRQAVREGLPWLPWEKN